MSPSTSRAEASDVDLGGQWHVDDGGPRRPIAQWLKALPETSDAPPVAPWPAVVPRQPLQRAAQPQPTLSPIQELPAEPTDELGSEFQLEEDLTAEAERAAYDSARVESARRELADARSTSRPAVPRGMAAVFLGCAALILGQAVYIVVSTAGTTAQAAELGQIVVSSHPSGARVLVQGVEQGTTPLVLRLATGPHRLELAGASGAIQPVDVEVLAGRSVSQHVELLAPPPAAGESSLVVDTGDPAAQLSIDGTPAGATSLASTRVTPGQHAVQVRYRGGGIVERQVIVPAGETVSLVLNPPMKRPSAPAGPVSGWVRVNAAFPVQVLERGQLVGNSGADRILVEAGSRTLELVNPALDFRASVTTQVTAGKVAEVVVDTPRVPVAINAQPWAQVMVDGRLHGDTPIANLMLPIGEHRVVLRHPDLGERVQMVTVRAAGVNRVSADLRR